MRLFANRILPRTKPPLWRRTLTYIKHVFTCDECGSSNISMFGVCFDCADKSYAVEAAPVFRFKRGDKVHKPKGDYRFRGIVLCAYYKLDGKAIRYDAENTDGVVHIFNGAQLEPGWPDESAQPTGG